MGDVKPPHPPTHVTRVQAVAIAVAVEIDGAHIARNGVVHGGQF